MIKRMVSSFLGDNAEFEKQYLRGEIEVEFTPQGSLAERLRAGANGIPAFYTRTGAGTLVETGGIPIKLDSSGKPEIVSGPKETREFNGKKYLLEESIKADFAFIKGWKADTKGNTVFRKTSRNFNPDIAGAAKTVIVEVEEIVPCGEIDPDEVHLSGVLVDRLVQGELYEKRIERLTFETSHGVLYPWPPAVKEKREKIAKRAAKEIRDGMFVNLGIGIPTFAGNFVPPHVDVMLHSENGLIGLGPYPKPGEEDPDLINAGKETVTAVDGSSYVQSSTAFGMIRGGHIDLTLLGALQCDENANIANWMVPGKIVRGMGGAMDLVSGVKKVVVAMDHTAHGEQKILESCSLPLTG